MTRLRILHLIPSLEYGGAERMLEKLVLGSDSRRFSHGIVSMSAPGPIGRELRQAGIPVTSLGMPMGRPTPAGLLKTVVAIKRHQPDIVQGWMYHANLLGLVCSSLAGNRRQIWGIRCSDMDLSRYSTLTGWVVRLNALWSKIPDAIIANSHAGAGFHRQMGFSNQRLRVIHNGFDTKRFCPDSRAGSRLCNQLKLPKTATIIGLVARVDPMKDHATFFRSAIKLLRKRLDVCFVLIGEKTDALPEIHLTDKLKQWAHRFRCLGARSDVQRLIPGLDVAVSASAFGEGFSNTIGEAMACGVPCVVTDVGDSARIVADTGLTVIPQDADAMADALERMILLDAKQKIRLSQLARKRIEQHYALPVVIEQFEQLYTTICAE